MPKKINLLNQHFGNLTVIHETNKRDSSGNIIWECQCNCGNIIEVPSHSLRSGHTKSCGCLQKLAASKLGKSHLKDLTNQKFGLLLVTKLAYNKKTPNGSSKYYWNCLCDCGTQIIVEGNALKTGNTKSCGCIKSFGEEKISSLLLQHNIPFEKEKIFSTCINSQTQYPYRFDFFVNNQYIIEYDGKQHYQNYSWGSNTYSKLEAQRKDNEKNLFCFKNNIPIIRIPYTHYNQLELKDLLLETSKFIIDMKDEVQRCVNEL